MANLDKSVLGYHDGKVASDDSCKLVNALIKLDICSDVTPDGRFSVSRRDKLKFVSYAKSKMRFSLSEPLGIYGFIIRNKVRYGAILAIVITTLIFAFSSGRIWDIRISGNESLSDYRIEKSLEDLGFKTGARWGKIDKNEIEIELLRTNPDIAWISVNRRGTVAYVEIIESENVGMIDDKGYPFSNIVADRDGVIEEITVESGVAIVKSGDVVRRGDVLISGVVQNESGVTYCRALGSVRAHSVINVGAEVPSEITEKIADSHKIAQIRLIIFNFSINIFKNYRNHGNNCDIIKENRKVALFDKYELPIKIEKTYIVSYTENTRIRSADEMANEAKRELDGKIYAMFKDADVIKLRTQSELTDGVYRITSRVVYSGEIGKESAIKIS